MHRGHLNTHTGHLMVRTVMSGSDLPCPGFSAVFGQVIRFSACGYPFGSRFDNLLVSALRRRVSGNLSFLSCILSCSHGALFVRRFR